MIIFIISWSRKRLKKQKEQNYLLHSPPASVWLDTPQNSAAESPSDLALLGRGRRERERRRSRAEPWWRRRRADGGRGEEKTRWLVSLKHRGGNHEWRHMWHAVMSSVFEQQLFPPIMFFFFLLFKWKQNFKQETHLRWSFPVFSYIQWNHFNVKLWLFL